jgi:hypothetical protein
MANSKVESTKKGNWGEFGGDTKMHGFAPTGTQTPGQSSQEGHSGSRRGIEPQAGGQVGFYSTGTTNKDYAGTAEAGCSGPSKSGPNNKFAEGGKTHMWGNRGSQKAVPGQSGCNG